MVRLHAIVLMRLTATASAIVSPKTKLLYKQQLKRISLAGGLLSVQICCACSRRCLHSARYASKIFITTTESAKKHGFSHWGFP